MLYFPEQGGTQNSIQVTFKLLQEAIAQPGFSIDNVVLYLTLWMKNS